MTNEPRDLPPSCTSRLLFAVAVGAVSALIAWYATHVSLPGRPSDFDQVWYAGRASLGGRNPYAEIGPGRVFNWPWPFFYPMTAAVVVAPLLPFTAEIARSIFIFTSSALLAWAVTREDWHHVPLFLGGAFITNALACQWSALLTAALCIPAIAWVAIGKPNLGALLLANPNRRSLTFAIAGGLAALAVSVAIAPYWPAEWFDVARAAFDDRNEEAIITSPGGFLVLLALLRWRRADARLILLLACLPLTVQAYSYLPLALVAATQRQASVLALLSWAAWLLPTAINAIDPTVGTPALLTLIYLTCNFVPALGLVLQRPNEGTILPWMERLTTRLPSGFRGRALSDPR